MHTDEPLAPSPDDLGRRATTALVWKFLSQGLTTSVQILTGIVLARLLMPTDFGILGMATMVTSLATIVGDFGLGQALVQRRQLTRDHIAAAYWGEITLGVLLTGLTFVLAPYVGLLFHEPRMVPVLRVLAVSFAIAPLSSIANSRLQRNLDFRRQFYGSIASSATYAVVGLTMAFSGYGYWSLAGALLASTTVGTITICSITGYLPPVVPSYHGLKDLLGFGVGATGVSVFNYIAQQADYFVVGRWLDSAALGLYTRAFMLVHQPLGLVANILSPVLFPMFTHLREQPEQARTIMGRVLTAVSMCTFPLLALFGVTSPQLIPLLFGTQWEGSILPAQILTFAGMLRTLVNPCATLPKAYGAVQAQAAINGVYCAALAALAIAGTRWGIIGVAYGVLVATFIVWLLNALLLRACSGFGARDYFRSLRGAMLCSLATFGCALAVRWSLEAQGASAFGVLVLTLVAGLSVAVLFTVFSPIQEYRAELHSLLARLDRRRRTPESTE